MGWACYCTNEPDLCAHVFYYCFNYFFHAICLKATSRSGLQFLFFQGPLPPTPRAGLPPLQSIWMYAWVSLIRSLAGRKHYLPTLCSKCHNRDSNPPSTDRTPELNSVLLTARPRHIHVSPDHTTSSSFVVRSKYGNPVQSIHPSRLLYVATPLTPGRDRHQKILSSLKVLENHSDQTGPSLSMKFLNRLERLHVYPLRLHTV